MHSARAETKHCALLALSARVQTNKMVMEYKDAFCSSPLLYILKVGKMQKGVFAFTFIIEIAQDVLWELHRDYLAKSG